MPHRALAALAALALTVTACTGEDPDPDASPAPGRPPTVTVLGENLELLPGTEHAVRLGFRAFQDAARIIVTAEPDTAGITICPLEDAMGSLEPESPGCRSVASGVREPLSRSGLGGVAIVLRGTAAARANLVLEFEEGERDLTFILPRLRAPRSGPCEDNACNPFFEVRPPVGGPFSARAAWDGPDGELLLLQGSVLARSRTATGIPYVESARAVGSSPLTMATQLTAPAEYALVFRHQRLRPGAAPLEDVVLRASWPRATSS